MTHMPRTPHVEADSLALLRRSLSLCLMMRNWPNDVLGELAAVGRLRRYDRRTSLMESHCTCCEVLVVASGRLEVEKVNASGMRFVQSIHGPGELVSLVRLLKNFSSLHQCLVQPGTVLVHLPCDAMLSILDAYPALWRDVGMQALSLLHEQLTQQQRRALGHTASQVADVLARLALSQGRRSEDGPEISLRLSQSDLAAMLAVSRQTVNKELRALVQAGMIRVGYGRITVRDLDALRCAADTPGM